MLAVDDPRGRRSRSDRHSLRNGQVGRRSRVGDQQDVRCATALPCLCLERPLMSSDGPKSSVWVSGEAKPGLRWGIWGIAERPSEFAHGGVRVGHAEAWLSRTRSLIRAPCGRVHHSIPHGESPVPGPIPQGTRVAAPVSGSDTVVPGRLHGSPPAGGMGREGRVRSPITGWSVRVRRGCGRTAERTGVTARPLRRASRGRYLLGGAGGLTAGFAPTDLSISTKSPDSLSNNTSPSDNGIEAVPWRSRRPGGLPPVVAIVGSNHAATLRVFTTTFSSREILPRWTA